MLTSVDTNGDRMTDGSRDELLWRKSKRCESGACVEVAADGNTVLVRNSANLGAAAITISRNRWVTFVAQIKDGAFDWT